MTRVELRPDPTFMAEILFATDLSDEAQVPFRHALALALSGEARIRILHVLSDLNAESRPAWDRFPQVRATLEQWGVPAERASALGVYKGLLVGRSPVDELLHHLELEPADLLVVGTHAYRGLERWLHRPVAVPLSRRAGGLTLFLPSGVPGFVDAQGRTALRRVLLPLAGEPSSAPAMEALARLVARLGLSDVVCTLLHVGDHPLPVDLPAQPGLTWESLVVAGDDPAAAILAQARSEEAGLIVMTTAGRHGLLDALRGSTTERVLAGAPCPVLAVTGR